VVSLFHDESLWRSLHGFRIKQHSQLPSPTDKECSTANNYVTNSQSSRLSSGAFETTTLVCSSTGTKSLAHLRINDPRHRGVVDRKHCVEVSRRVASEEPRVSHIDPDDNNRNNE